MESFTLAMLLSAHRKDSLAWSALPDAPVVPDRSTRRSASWAARPRAALARSLERLARFVAPAQTTCSTAS